MLTLEVAVSTMTVNSPISRLISLSMFLAGNLRKSLFAVAIVSGLLSLFFAQRGVDTPKDFDIARIMRDIADLAVSRRKS